MDIWILYKLRLVINLSRKRDSTSLGVWHHAIYSNMKILTFNHYQHATSADTNFSYR